MELELEVRIAAQTKAAAEELIAVSGLKAGQILVVGCSSSEILGAHIGKGSSPEAAAVVYHTLDSVLKEKGIYLAAQCCEHLNRALIVEEACARTYGLEPVCVRPIPHDGGSFATAVYEAMQSPVAVEHIRAHAGMDIGDTLIGMHLRDVAVPVRLSTASIGDAHLVCARTRPKFIGGSRAVYPGTEVR